MVYCRFLTGLFAIAALGIALSGCSSGVRQKEPVAEKAEEPAPAADPAKLENGAIDPNAKGPFKRVFHIVDKAQAMADNPNYVETVNTIEAGDYFTGVAQGAFAAASQVQTIGLQHFVNLHEAQHGKRPTLDEIKAYLKSNGMKLKGLYPYQVYAYDGETGKISVLEDLAEKAKREGR